MPAGQHSLATAQPGTSNRSPAALHKAAHAYDRVIMACCSRASPLLQHPTYDAYSMHGHDCGRLAAPCRLFHAWFRAFTPRFSSCARSFAFCCFTLWSSLLKHVRLCMYSLRERRRCVVVLLCGTSGSGKSTLASILVSAALHNRRQLRLTLRLACCCMQKDAAMHDGGDVM